MQTKEGPDDLTPREREVFGLLRLGLTNEEIAERLGISLDGAKYHVSQILSKLGVATREEAAAVPVEARRRWWVMLPLAAKAAGAAVVLAAVGGLGLLAWGVVQTSGGGADIGSAISVDEAKSLLPEMVLQPEDVPAGMTRGNGEYTGQGVMFGELVAYSLRYALEVGEASPPEVPCISSSVGVYGTVEDASRGLDSATGVAAQLGEEIVLPSIGEEAFGFVSNRPEATSCGSYDLYIAFRIANTLSTLNSWFSEDRGEFDQSDVDRSVEYARRQARRVDDVLGGAPLPVSQPAFEGPRIGDHWHAPYQFFACGERQPNAAVWESGVHTHGDGIIHIHPFQTWEEGPGASLVRWFEYGGGRLTETEINIPGSAETYRNGDLCPDGEPGELQVFVTHVEESAEERLEGDALLQYIPHDGDRIRIVFGPPEDPIIYTPEPEAAEPTPRSTLP